MSYDRARVSDLFALHSDKAAHEHADSNLENGRGFELLDPLRNGRDLRANGQLVRDVVAPGRDLGHSDREHAASRCRSGDSVRAYRARSSLVQIFSAPLWPDSLALFTGEAQGRPLERKLR